MADSGGDEGTRTPDPLLAKEVLSQLSYIPTRRCILAENHRAIAVEEDAVLDVPAHGAGEGHALHVAPDARELGDAMGVVDAGDLLLDDRPFVEVLGDVVGGGTDELHTAGVGLRVGAGTLEGGQERVVDVDRAPGERAARVGTQDLHVAREDDELDAVLADEVE